MLYKKTSAFEVALKLVEQNNPQINKVYIHDLAEMIRKTNTVFYKPSEGSVPVKIILRLTLPLALLVLSLLIVLLPINFMITGKWRYSSNRATDLIFVWIKNLGLA